MNRNTYLIIAGILILSITQVVINMRKTVSDTKTVPAEILDRKLKGDEILVNMEEPYGKSAKGSIMVTYVYHHKGSCPQLHGGNIVVAHYYTLPPAVTTLPCAVCAKPYKDNAPNHDHIMKLLDELSAVPGYTEMGYETLRQNLFAEFERKAYHAILMSKYPYRTQTYAEFCSYLGYDKDEDH